MADWQVGDLALCVGWVEPQNDVAFKDTKAGKPVIGLIYAVVAVATGYDVYYRQDVALALRQIEQPPSKFGRLVGYNGDCFRKITPPQADAFDRGVIEAMCGEPVEAAARDHAARVITELQKVAGE